MNKDKKAGSNQDEGFSAELEEDEEYEEDEGVYEDELDEYDEDELDEDEELEDDEEYEEEPDEDEEYGEYEDEEYEEEEYEEATPKEPSRFDRVRARLQPPSTTKPSVPTKQPSPTKSSSTDAPKSDIAVKWSIDRLNERERLFSFGGAVLAAIFGVAIYLTETHNSHFRLAKNQLTPQTTLIVGLAAGVLLAGATFIGRRAPVGFVALFTGAGFSGSTFVLAIPFWALAFWLLYRSYKLQREAAATARAEARARPRSANTRATGGRGSGSRKAKAGTNTGPKRPEANKRYTPPRPPPKPKPAPPARRSRKSPTKKD
ncbi:MAG: hypothetical protein QOJ44_501 [Acidimicrobiaceae bacterium]|jgi:hypothetical protein|nr:hypothetical protein [Acidimicrobiaceae bacterium]